jgi:hypothetical protein
MNNNKQMAMMNRLTNLPEDIQEKIKWEVFKNGTTLDYDEDLGGYSVEAIKKHIREFKIEDIVYLRTINNHDKADLKKLNMQRGSIWEKRVRLFEKHLGYKLRKNHPVKLFWIDGKEYPEYEIINFKAYIKI